MALQSRDIDGVDEQGRGRTVNSQTQPKGPQIPPAYGAMAILIGVLLWPLGAWYTASGWAWLITYLLGKIGLFWVVPQPSGVYGLIAAGAIGYAYSRIELSPPNLRRLGLVAFVLVGLIWLVVIVSDVGTTLAGTLQPARPDSLALFRWIAGVPVAAAMWALVLTFAPDQAILRGWRVLRGKSIL